MKKFFIGLLIVGLAALIIYILFPRSSKPKILKTATVVRGPITAFVEETGIVKPQVGALIKVGTRATGLLTYLPYQVGDFVKKGELLARIDDREIVANLNRARATLKSLQAELKLIDTTYPLSIKEQEARVQAAKARYDYAVLNLSREELLLKQEFTTQDSVDQARREKAVKGADYKVALETLNRLQGEYKQKRHTLLAKIKAQREEVKSLEVKLSYTKIYAPISGYVSQVATQQGETVVAGLSAPNLITLIDPTKLEVWLYVDETDIGRVNIGQEVLYYVDAYPDKWFHGKILILYPEPEVKQNIVYYLAIVKVSPADARVIRPEMTVHARIITQKKQNALLIPNEALKFEKGVPLVYKIKDNQLIPTKVKIGLRGEKEIEILSGLKAGEKVALKFVSPR